MNSLRRHKIAADYRRGLEQLSGDAPSSGVSASDIINVLAEAGKGTAQIVEKEEAAKKAKASSAEVDAAVKAAADMRKRADLAKADAIAESNPNGELHKQAAALDVSAKVAEARAAVLKGGGSMSDANKAASKASGKSGGLPSWVVPVGVGIGAGGLLFVLYKLLKRK